MRLLTNTRYEAFEAPQWYTGNICITVQPDMGFLLTRVISCFTGLTEDHPTLTTYFEGEIIGSKYGFTTKQKSWGANDRIDMSHWAKFPAFHPFVRQAKKGNLVIKEYLQQENIFMRWKEHFLVPDHRVRTIHGASFEGFYYICFNQVEGVVHGIYFHSKSEKYAPTVVSYHVSLSTDSAVQIPAA